MLAVHSFGAGCDDIEKAATAGALGNPLLPDDMALVQMRPLRPYSLGELCAYASEHADADQQHGMVA